MTKYSPADTVIVILLPAFTSVPGFKLSERTVFLSLSSVSSCLTLSISRPFFSSSSMASDGLSKDIDQMCDSYSKHMFSMGGLDLAITGIGDDGHVAFNEPDTYLLPRTHAVALKESTIQANARFFNSIEEVPQRAVSIGMEDIMRTKTFLVVASGEKKAPLLQKLFANGHIDPMYPVSFTRMHPNAILILDEAAAALVDPAVLKEYTS